MAFDAFVALGTLAQAGTQIATGVQARSEARKQADKARDIGALVAEDERAKGRKLSASQRAAFAKAGVKITSGTPLDVLAQTEADAETNAIRARFEFEQRAEDLESFGKVALTQGILGSGTTILGKGETFRDVFNSFRSTPATRTSVATSGFRPSSGRISPVGFTAPATSRSPTKVI